MADLHYLRLKTVERLKRGEGNGRQDKTRQDKTMRLFHRPAVSAACCRSPFNSELPDKGLEKTLRICGLRPESDIYAGVTMLTGMLCMKGHNQL